MKISPTSLVPGEKRKVGIISLNLHGFENTAKTLQDESAKKLTSLTMGELTSCVLSFGGEIAQTTQYGIVALFCAVQGSQQTCQQVIRCCFRILQNLTLLSKNIEVDHDHIVLTCSIGVAWGSATVTSYQDGGVSVDGDCVDLSSSLRNTAPEQTILVSEKVKSACLEFFDWKPFTDKVWIPVQKTDSHTYHPLLYKIPLLGRNRELQQLTEAYDSYRKWYNHPAMFITGKPGSGKTHFVDHFLKSIPMDETKIIKLNNKLWDQPPLGTWLPLIKKGTFDPYGTVMAEIRRVCSEGYLILVIEDLHWADSASKKLMDQLSRALTEAGVFLIVTSRNPPRDFLLGSSEQLQLQGLDKDAIICLLESILGKPDGSEDKRFADFLIESTGGNPLLLTEQVLHAVETGIIGRDSSNAWFLDKKLDHFVSDTAESFLQARLSVLKPDEKFALQVAAVLGSGFQANLFSDVFAGLGKKSARLLLSRLLNNGFLTTGKDESFHFLNSLIAETVYNTILKENKLIIHRKAAEVLSEKKNSGEKSAVAITLSRHWIRSGSGESAIPWLISAMEQYLDAGDVNRAEVLSMELQERISSGSEYSSTTEFLNMRLYVLMGKFQFALNTAEKILTLFSGKELALIYLVMAQSKENLGLPLKDALKDYMTAAEIAESAGDKNTLANSLGSAGTVNASLGNNNEALLVLNKALGYENSLDTKSLARLHGNMGIIMQRTGNLQDALSHYTQTYELGKKSGDSTIEANALAYMGHVEISMGHKSNGIEKYREALTIHRRSGNTRGECIVLGNLGGIMARYGESQAAINTLQRAIHLAEEIGHTRGIVAFHANIGLAYKQVGEYEKAEKHIRESMEMLRKAGDKRALAVCHLNLSTVLAKMLKLQEAIGEARRALRFACTVNALTTQARALGTLGSLMLKTDRAGTALFFFREAFKRSSLAEDHSTLSVHLTGESKSLLELNRREEALEKYSEILKLKDKYPMDFEGEVDLKDLEESLGISLSEERED